MWTGAAPHATLMWPGARNVVAIGAPKEMKPRTKLNDISHSVLCNLAIASSADQKASNVTAGLRSSNHRWTLLESTVCFN
jgi:hypothetical protein